MLGHGGQGSRKFVSKNHHAHSARHRPCFDNGRGYETQCTISKGGKRGRVDLWALPYIIEKRKMATVGPSVADEGPVQYAQCTLWK